MEPTTERTIRIRGRDIPILTQDEVRRRYLDDLPERLERFIEAAGWSWRELAAQLGVSERRVAGWRKGHTPKGGAMHGLFVLAARTPGGMEALYPELADGFAAAAEEAAEAAAKAEAEEAAEEEAEEEAEAEDEQWE